MKNSKLGFTLIELLIVIAILGILAIGLMAALDPMEQLKKARDTSTRNTVEEFYNACLRYNATKGYYPWTSSGITSETLVNLTDDYIISLINMGELKSGFTNDASKLEKVFITSTNAGTSHNMDDLAACFDPDSKAISQEDNTRFNNDGSVAGATCPGLTVPCYWCVK